MLSRIAREFAAEINQHDWSDAPYRLDRAGHQRTFDTGWQTMPRLSDDETDCVRTNVMWVALQVLGHADPNIDIQEFAAACGVSIKPGILRAGLRGGGSSWGIPGSYDFADEPRPGIQWLCHRCGKAVPDGEGGLMLSMSDVDRYDAEAAAWRTANAGPVDGLVEFGALASFPEEAPWRVLHFDCAPDGDEGYCISVETARTPWALIDWTTQLMTKTWMASTDWEDLLRDALRRAPRDEVGKGVGD